MVGGTVDVATADGGEVVSGVSATPGSPHATSAIVMAKPRVVLTVFARASITLRRHAAGPGSLPVVVGRLYRDL